MLIETALGMANVEAIAQSSKRLEAMSFGVADYAASTRARTTVIGGVNPDYGVLSDKDEEGNRQNFWTDPWHAAQTRMLVACARLRPASDRRSVRRFRRYRTAIIAAAKRAAVLGFEGKWAIHPSQIELANQVFTPSSAEVTKARRILEAMEQAAKEGRGAVSLDGRLIDIASIRMAAGADRQGGSDRRGVRGSAQALIRPRFTGPPSPALREKGERRGPMYCVNAQEWSGALLLPLVGEGGPAKPGRMRVLACRRKSPSRRPPSREGFAAT